MARRGMMIAGALLALLVVVGGLVVTTEGVRLLTLGRVLLWYGPDEAARAWEAYTHPHALRDVLAVNSHGRLGGWPRVRWLLWKDRLATLREPLWRHKEMAWALGLGGGALLLVLLRASWGLLGWVWFLVRGIGRLTPGTSAGSARWATAREARRDYSPRWPVLRRLGVLRREPPFVIGRVGGRRLWLSGKRQGLNILALGVPGEGKTAATVIPGLLRETGALSVFSSDPKGECWAVAGRVLAARGYTVRRLDFLDPTGAGAHYNPLAHLHTPDDALVFAQGWIFATREQGEEGGSAEFWDGTAALMIVAGALHLNHIYRERTGQAAPLAALPALFSGDSYEALEETLLHSPCQDAQDAARGFLVGLKMHGKLGGAVLVGLVVNFTALANPAIAATTATDDLDFTAMGRTDTAPLAVFVILTPHKETVLCPLTSCLFMQMFAALMDEGNTRPRNMLARPVMGYLDEIGTVARIRGLPDDLARLRAAGVGMLLACQDTIQLDRLYTPEGRRTITTTCQTHLVFSGVGQEDVAWVSQRLGTTTVVGGGASAGRNREQLLVGQGGHNRAEVGRPLMFPEEIQQLPEGWLIANALHARPVLVRALPWFKDRALRRLVARQTKRAAVITAAAAQQQPQPLQPAQPVRDTTG